MLDVLWKMMSFFILIAILVGFHEFGHFYVARKLGIKVLQFSIGFGKRLYTYKAKDGCEYILGAIPLGGFVKMLDEAEGNVSQDQKHLAFNTQPIWKRFLVVLAGPFANALLAFVLLLGLYIYGIPAHKAEIGTPMPDSIFAHAQLQKGDIILRVDNKNISSFQQLSMTLIDKLGGDGRANLHIQRHNTEMAVNIDLGHPLQVSGKGDPLSELGLSLNLPDYKILIGKVFEGQPAFNAGIKEKDEVVGINNQSVTDYRMVSYLLKKNGAKPAIFQVKRDNQLQVLSVAPIQNDQGQFVVGIQLMHDVSDKAAFDSALKSLVITERYSVFDSAHRAYQEVVDNGLMVFKFIGRMIKGDVKIDAMAGPLSIADIAGSALASGLVSFITLVALLSVNIGAMNLIPIPVLDGGRLVGYMFEAIANLFKVKISKRLSLFCLQAGGILVMGFMLLVVFYDVMKFVFK